MESDEFYIGERVDFDVDVATLGAADSAAAAVLTVALPDGTRATPTVTVAPFSHAHAELDTTLAGWHEWRWESTGDGGTGLFSPEAPTLLPNSPLMTPDAVGAGTPVAAVQGRFRVLPKNT